MFGLYILFKNNQQKARFEFICLKNVTWIFSLKSGFISDFIAGIIKH
jgi:hypothetical protein